MIWASQLRRTRIGLTVANLVGALTVFAFLQFIVPLPASVVHKLWLLWLNVGLFVLTGVIFTAAANYLGVRAAREVRDWFLSGAAPNPREREQALRQPLVQTKIDAVLWLGATTLFTAVNVFGSAQNAAVIGFTIALGGLASCALTYLLSERFGREMTAAALAGSVPEDPAGPDVATRVIVAWGLAAAIPLLGCALLAGEVLVVGRLSRDQVAIRLLLVSVVGLVLGLISTRIAGRSLIDPIETVRAGLRRVQSGDLTTEIPIYDGSEIGLLQAGFNEMTAGLRDRERIREAFGTYLDRDVAEHILASGTAIEGEEVEVTAMFIDIRDFTGFAERTEARDVVSAINSLFAKIVPIVHAHGGYVDKFVGDGLLAVFGAPRRLEDHADSAFAAALEVERAVEDELPVGIGLSSGPVIAGNVGGAGRLEFSVIGDAVNVAARVEAATRDTGDTMLVSEQTRALLSDPSKLEARPPLPLKGKSESVALFAPRVGARAAR